MIPARRATVLAVALFACALSGGCGEDATAPASSLVGTWDIIGFTDAGVAATTTGTWVFRSDETFSVNGTVTFPGEPADPIVFDGTYAQSGMTVSLVITGEATTSWRLAATGDQVTLTADEAPPANTITLRRR
jgi:hypothetical protein